MPESERSPGEGNGNPLQYSLQGNPMNRGAWRATVHVVARVGHDWATPQQHSPVRVVIGFWGCLSSFSMFSSESGTRECVLFVTTDSFQEDLNSAAKSTSCKMKTTTSSAPWHPMPIWRLFSSYPQRCVSKRQEPLSSAYFVKILPSSFCTVLTLYWVYLPVLSMGSSLSNSFQNSGLSAWMHFFLLPPYGDDLLCFIMCLKVSGGCQHSSLFSLQRTNHCSVCCFL